MTESNNTLPPSSSASADPKELSADREPSAQDAPSTDQAPSAQDEPSTGNQKEPSADKEPSAEKQPSAAVSEKSPKAADTPKSTDVTQTYPPVKTKASGHARFALFIALLALFTVAAASVYFWQKQEQQNTRISQLLDQSSDQKQQLNSQQRSTEQKLTSLDNRLLEQQNSLSSLSQQTYHNTQKLADLGARSRMDWLLAEAEYLMRLANQRLNLEQDIQSAEAMLSNADSILAEINDPGLIEIRQTLAREIISLQQVRHLDYQGLYFRLEALIKSIDRLEQQTFLSAHNDQTNPSDSATNEAPETQNSAGTNVLASLWQSIWQDLKQAVTIRRLDQPLPPLLAPEQHYYLKQNLRLMLEQASLALLDKNAEVYQASLTKAAAWLTQYFLQKDPQIQQIQKTLNEMASYEVSLKLPDISHSLRLTKAKIESFYRQHSLNKLNSPDSESATDTGQPANPLKNSTSSNEGAAL